MPAQALRLLVGTWPALLLHIDMSISRHVSSHSLGLLSRKEKSDGKIQSPVNPRLRELALLGPLLPSATAPSSLISGAVPLLPCFLSTPDPRPRLSSSVALTLVYLKPNFSVWKLISTGLLCSKPFWRMWKSWQSKKKKKEI